MERSDRIGFIVATVLVVALLAGSAFLVWKRVDTLAADRAGSGEATVTLAPIETTESVSAPPAEPTPVAKPEAPKQPKGSELGYVTRVRKTGSTYYVTYDPAALLTGGEADLYVKKQGKLGATEGFMIANDTHKVKRMPLSKRVEIVTASTSDAGKPATMTPDALLTAYGSSSPDPAFKQATWWVFSSGGVILRLEQVVLQ